MSKSIHSVFSVLTGRKMVDTYTREVAGRCVKRFLQEVLNKHGIRDINEEDIEELSFDIIDELCSENYLVH